MRTNIRVEWFDGYNLIEELGTLIEERGDPRLRRQPVEIRLGQWDERFVLVALNGQRKAVGYSEINPNAFIYERFGYPAKTPQVWIRSIYVAPQCRQQGVGRNLVEMIAEFALENDLPYVGLKLDQEITEMETRIAFFESLGFERCTVPGAEDGFFAEPDKLLGSA